jgi:hypothetical protein
MKTKTKILPRKRASDPRSANQIASDRDYAKRFPLKAAEDKALTKRLAAHSRRAKRVRAGATTAPNVSALHREIAVASKAYADERQARGRLTLELRAAMKRNDEIGAELARCRSIIARHDNHSTPMCMTAQAVLTALSGYQDSCRVRIYYVLPGSVAAARADDVVHVRCSKDHNGEPVVYLHARAVQEYRVEQNDR